MAEQETTIENEVDEVVAPRAILLELDNVAANGRRFIYDSLKTILKGKGTELSPTKFSRYCLDRSLAVFIPEILEQVGGKRLSPATIIDALNGRIKKWASDKDRKPPPVFQDMMKKAAKASISIGAFASLNEESARQLATHLGLSEDDVPIMSPASEEKRFPSTDVWQKLARSLSVPQTACVAIVTTAQSCRTALAAHMRCIVIPDEFSTFQDFGGADHVLEEFDRTVVKVTFDLLEF